ncbi:MAG TPA: MEDS domain-containing protein [Sporichthyaceae bacterium]|nr:MEDS domain-containing protein [Sporichthyaceae bacterium]
MTNLGSAVLDEAPEGTHLAVLFGDPAERETLLTRYLAGAVRRGEGAVCVTAEAAHELTGSVRRVVGPTAEVAVVPTHDSYLRGGQFSAQFMAGWVADLVRQAPSGGVERQCIAGVLDWCGDLDASGFEDLYRYESTLNLLAPTIRHTLACFYDLQVLPAAQIINVLRTHPRVVISGTVWDSPFYDEEELRPLPLPQ